MLKPEFLDSIKTLKFPETLATFLPGRKEELKLRSSYPGPVVSTHHCPHQHHPFPFSINIHWFPPLMRTGRILQPIERSAEDPSHGKYPLCHSHHLQKMPTCWAERRATEEWHRYRTLNVFSSSIRNTVCHTTHFKLSQNTVFINCLVCLLYRQPLLFSHMTCLGAILIKDSDHTVSIFSFFSVVGPLSFS